MYILTGIKHCGKSTIGRLLASYKNIPFIDLDMEIESVFSPDRKFSFRDIYRMEGKSGFQELEVKALVKIMDTNPQEAVLALGGGTAENKRAMDIVKDGGITVYLYEKEEILFERILDNGIPPFLEGDSPEILFHNLYKKRDPLYHSHADIVVRLEGRNPEEAARWTALNIDRYLRRI